MNNNVFFRWKVERDYYRTKVSDILYFESDNRKVLMKTVNHTYSFYGKLSDVAKQLEPEGFWQIHKSFLVNPKYIESLEYNEIVMANSDILPISQSRRKYIKMLQFEMD